MTPSGSSCRSFNGIPHLLRPVVTEMRPEKDSGDRKKGPREITAIEVLKWLLWEMERRYRLFARGGEGQGRRQQDLPQHRAVPHRRARQPGTMEPLPYIVLIIDELADLMLVAPEDVETALCRLAQLARATGIHLIIATQRPSVDVVTGLIKANFPARLAFAVTSMIDSRVILDTPGAEKLLGRGDALYTASDESKPIRVQGTFVSDKEAEKVVNFWRVQMAAAARAAAAAPAPPPPTAPPRAGAAPLHAGQANVPEPDWLKDLDAGGDGEEEDAMLQGGDRPGQEAQVRLAPPCSSAACASATTAPPAWSSRWRSMGIVGPADGSRSREVLISGDDAPAEGEE